MIASLALMMFWEILMKRELDCCFPGESVGSKWVKDREIHTSMVRTLSLFPPNTFKTYNAANV